MIPGVEVTVGSESDPAAQAVNAMGGKHIAKKVTVSCSVTHMCMYHDNNNLKFRLTGHSPAYINH